MGTSSTYFSLNEYGDVGAIGLQLRRFGRHFDRLARAADLELHVHARTGVSLHDARLSAR